MQSLADSTMAHSRGTPRDTPLPVDILSSHRYLLFNVIAINAPRRCTFFAVDSFLHYSPLRRPLHCELLAKMRGVRLFYALEVFNCDAYKNTIVQLKRRRAYASLSEWEREYSTKHLPTPKNENPAQVLHFSFVSRTNCSQKGGRHATVAPRSRHPLTFPTAPGTFP